MCRSCWQLLLTVALTIPLLAAANTPDELPLPANQVMYMAENAGADIGLPFGATKTYAIGRSLQRQGESEAALVYLHRAHQLAPDAHRIATTYARCLLEAGYVHDAARIFGQLVTREPDDLDQRLQYAQLLAQSGRSQLALEQVRELRRRGRDDPGMTKLEAELLGQLGRVDEAIEVYREAGRRHPDRTEDFVLAAGLLLQRHERIEEMAELLREGLERVPESRAMRLALVRYYAHGDRLEDAHREAARGDKRRRKAKASERPECRLELAQILARRGDYEMAADVLASARDDGFHDRETDAQLARYYLTLEKTAESIDLLDEAADRWPDDAELRFLRGRALELVDDREGAYANLERAVSLEPTVPLYRISMLRHMVIFQQEALSAQEPDDAQLDLQVSAREHATQASASVHPQDAGGHMILGAAFRSLGDLDRACRHFKLASEQKESRVAALLELGFCQQQAGQEDAALTTLAMLRDEYPDDPEVANSYGYFLAEAGRDLELAEALVRQALVSAPENGAYLDTLGWIFYQRGDYSAAFDWLVRAANSRPEDPVILEHLGRTLASLGKHDEAIDVLRRAVAAGGDRTQLVPLIDELTRDG